jgi:hypothetical protein
MVDRKKLAGYLALLGSVLGIVGTYMIFLKWYTPALHAESAEPGCEILLKYLMPALSDFGILGGVLYAVSAYGFFTAAGWAFPLVVLANVLALQGSWFINVPFMAADLPPVYFIIFWPNLLLYFLFVKVVGRVSWRRTLLGLLTGMTFIFCFMNGVASLSRIIVLPGMHIFVIVQRLHWIASIGWGAVTVGILLQPREWMRVVGLSAGLLELIVGIPLAIVTARMLGRFSLFSLAPFFSFILTTMFVWPSVWQRLTRSEDAPMASFEGSKAAQTA